MRTTENNTIAPRFRQIATGRLVLGKGQSAPSLVFVEPTLITIQEVLPARVLTRVRTVTPQPSQVASQLGVAESGASVHRAHVMLANSSKEPLTIPKSTVTAIAEPVSEVLVNLVNSEGQSGAESLSVPRRKEGTKLSTANY